MMKILVLGSGLMGPAAAFNALSDPQVSQVTIGDKSQQQLDACAKKLAGVPGADRLRTALLDLNDQAATARLMADCSAALSALPRNVNALAIPAALRANTPLVDLTRLSLQQHSF
jgi:saccharopine dehydrogenase-like NADP-dependent oxidoreductase